MAVAICNYHIVAVNHIETELIFTVRQVEGQKYVTLNNATKEEKNCDFTGEVYVSNIPRNCSVENLLNHLLQVGKVYILRILMDFSGFNRGRCFVIYTSVKASRQAICCLHNESFMGNLLCVKLSLNNNQLILKSIPMWLSDEKVKELVMLCISNDLEEVVVKKSKFFERKHCFCKFRNHQAAAKAHKQIWPYINVQGNLLDVHWALPPITRFSKKLYFINNPASMNKTDFFYWLASVINIGDLVQLRYFQNNFGCITFVHLAALQTAQKALEDACMPAYQLKFNTEPFQEMDCETSEYKPLVTHVSNSVQMQRLECTGVRDVPRVSSTSSHAAYQYTTTPLYQMPEIKHSMNFNYSTMSLVRWRPKLLTSRVAIGSNLKRALNL